MMQLSKNKVKLLIWLSLGVIAVAFLLAAVRLTAQLAVNFRQGADPGAALNIVPNRPADWHSQVNWLPDDADTGREMEPFTREQIESAYTRAWLQLHLSYIKGGAFGLKTYFVGPALQAASDTVSLSTENGWRIEQTDTLHNLQLHFYSADGSIVGFTDHNAILAEGVHDFEGNLIAVNETQASFEVVMFLEDGNWRVRHWLRVEPDLPAVEIVEPPAGIVTADGDQLMLDGEPYHMAGVNYYPAETPWDLFWTEYDGSVIDRDLALMQSLQLNTIRIFIPFEQFGGPQLNSQMTDKFENFLDQADGRNLKVIVTLFDFRTDYALIHWGAADRHAEQLVSRFQDHPAILAWDLKNQPDLDFAASDQLRVNAFLRHVAKTVRGADPNHLVTIGWLNPESAAEMEDVVDFVSFHFYAPADQLPVRYEQLRLVTTKPIAITEFGLPTWNSFFFPNGHTRPEQAVYFADIIGHLRQLDAAGYVAWTLYDFDHIPSQVAGRMPWERGPERNLGIAESDGTLKPAAALLAPDASLELLRPPAWARFLKPFWLMVMGLFLLVSYLTITIIPSRLDLLKRFADQPDFESEIEPDDGS